MRVVIFLLFIVISSFNVNALAIASDYLKDKTLLLEDDTSTLYGIRLQNSKSEETKVQLTYDATVAKIIDYQEIYTIPPKTNLPIWFNVSAPKNSKPGDTYAVGYGVHQLPDGNSNFLLMSINRNFNVKIIKNPDNFYIDELYPYIPASIGVLIVVYFLLRKKYKKNNVFKKRKIINGIAQ